MIYFIADTHFGHSNIIRFCPNTRPYVNSEEMDEKLIEKWNSIVKPEDTVYHLGDVFFRSNRGNNRVIFNRLNGTKHLIRGNHDNHNTTSLEWASVNDYLEIKHNSRLIVLCHYPIASWRNKSHGSIHLYGHVHGKSPIAAVPNCWDVGVDSLGFNGPVSIDEIFQKASTND